MIENVDVPDVPPEVLSEQVAYYRARADEYDDTYERRGRYDRGAERNAEWLSEMALVELALAATAIEWVPVRTWDGVVTCFFLEHVPDQHLPSLLSKVADAVRPGGTVFLADGAYVPSHDQVEIRELDEREYRVVERRRRPDELQSLFDTAGFTLEVRTTGSRFCYGVGRRR